MTQISGNFSTPRAYADSRISAAVSAGTISTEDQKAISSALDVIDQALSTGEAGKSPRDVKANIDSLLAKQVEAGTLTQEQADQFKEIMAKGRPRGEMEGASDMGAQQSSTDALDTLIALLQQIRDSQESSTYGSDKTEDSTTKGQIIDTLA